MLLLYVVGGTESIIFRWDGYQQALYTLGALNRRIGLHCTGLLTNFESRMESTHIPLVIFLVGIVLLATASSRVFSRRRELHPSSEWTIARDHTTKRIKEHIENYDEKTSTQSHLESFSIFNPSYG